MDQEKFGLFRKEILVQLVFSIGIFRLVKIFGSRGVICPSNWLTITGPCKWSNINVAFEMLLWTAAVFLLICELVWDHDWKGLLQACRSNWLILGFVGLAGVSLIWSIQFDITLYKLVILLLSSMMAIYIGHIFDLAQLLKRFTRFFVLVSLLNLLIVFIYPDFGIMSYPFYNAAWNGIFFHRNYLGVFTALGMVLFLVNVLSYKNKRKAKILLNLVMLVITLVLLVKSNAATGIISALVTGSLMIVLFAWLRWGQNLKPWHYAGFLSGALIAFILVMTHLNFFLGFLGRNASLTGRLPMWQYLFQNVINQRPWFGYGYGAIWHLEGFMSEMTDIVNWGTPVMLGDNGFIDILLHLGVVGLSVLFLMITMGFIRGVRYFLQERTIVAAIPIIVLVFGVVANISKSLILELESLVWMIAVASLVAIGSDESTKNSP